MSNDTYQSQQDLAERLTHEMIEQGGSAIGQAQVVALVAGKLALNARQAMEDDQYKVFVRELAQAVLDEAGLSGKTTHSH